MLLHFQAETEGRIDAGGVWEKCHDLGYNGHTSTAKLQKQLHPNTTKVETQGKQVVHHLDFHIRC